MDYTATSLPPATLQLPPGLHPPATLPPPRTVFHQQAQQHGLLLIDLCGGLATSLDAVLRLGYKVQVYAYADVDAEARWAAHHRIQQLALTYPSQLPANTAHTFLAHLP